MEKLFSDIIIPDSSIQTSDIIVSNGSNDSSLIDAFNERYKFKVGGAPYLLPKGYDFNETGFFYGKVDTLGRAILPKKESLVEVDTKFTDGEIIYLNKDLYALYLDFYEKIKIDFTLNKLDIALFKEVFTIAKGSGFFGETQQNYKVYVADYLSELYIDYYISSGRNIDNAINFETYLENIINLFKVVDIDKLVLYNEYLLSFNYPITKTGLAFEIQNDVNYDDNLGKFETYYRFPVFGRVLCLLYIYGMRYDKNAPWRYVMDFNLPPTAKKIGSVTKQEYFNNNFNVVEGTLDEMKAFFDTIYLSYKDLLQKAPIIKKDEQIITACISGKRTRTKTNRSYSVYREDLTRAEFERYLNKNFDKLIIEYAIILNSLYNKGRDIKNILYTISNKNKLGLDKEDLVRYTFNKIKYC
tara:strand:- start:258 stop:1496 length:1239 start_codon:yes stop_codon:yes gene_type:complete